MMIKDCCSAFISACSCLIALGAKLIEIKLRVAVLIAEPMATNR